MLGNRVLRQDDLAEGVKNSEEQPFGASGKLETGNTGSGGGQIGDRAVGQIMARAVRWAKALQ
jgi:hypothetical protein